MALALLCLLAAVVASVMGKFGTDKLKYISFIVFNRLYVAQQGDV
jgi:hypothetical protein